MELKSFEQIVENAKNNPAPPTGAVVAAEEKNVFEAVVRAKKERVSEAVLIGNRKAIEENCSEFGVSPEDFEIVEAEDSMAAAKTAVKMVREGKASFLIKGGVQTGDLMKAVLDRENGLRTGKSISALLTFKIPNYKKMITVTDTGIMIYPTLEQKVDLIKNGVDYLHGLGIECPKVAVIAPNERINPKIQETMDGAALKEMYQQGKFEGCVVEGPITYDLAISERMAKSKKYESPVAGDADLLIFHNLSLANLYGKSMEITCGADCAGLIMGAAAPITSYSRGSTAENKFVGIAMAASNCKS